MDISVIVPIYKGQKYIPSLQKMVSQNIEYAQENGHPLEVELLLINDFPNELIHVDEVYKGYDVKIFENKKNCGIHQTRVNGLKMAKGDFILFLDQDDEIMPNCLYSQVMTIGTADIVVGNGQRFLNGKYREIYKSETKQRLVKCEKIYLKAANQIVSPGHCLIRKGSIPSEWKDYIISRNGGDDMFLWILMFEKGCEFAINKQNIYKHVDTGINVSSDLVGMLSSAENVIKEANYCKSIRKKSIKQYNRRINFLKKLNSDTSKAKKIITALIYADICLYKLVAFYA